MKADLIVFFTVVMGGLLMPAAVSAQSAGIVGTVRDTTGAVLPGVTVEASSPALIERVRSAATDGEGKYRIVDLRPGIYTVAFTLAGFNTVKREGIELTAQFTASVNAEMKVGALEETITVSGATPVVDVQNVAVQRPMTRDVIEAIPTSKGFAQFGGLIPGMVLGGSSHTLQDVGGQSGQGFVRMAIHGGVVGDQQTYLDSLAITNLSSDGASTNGPPIEGNVQEWVFETSGRSAETETGGVRINMVPKEGGNTYHGSFFGNKAAAGWQANNVTDELIKRGLNGKANRVKSLWDVSGGIGGPIKQDKLWFFIAAEQKVTDNYLASVFINKAYEYEGRNTWKYDPDFDRPALWDQHDYGLNIRATWQATPRNRFNVYREYNVLCNCHFTGANTTTTNEAATKAHFMNHIQQATWSSAITSKFLIQAGYGDYYINPWFLDVQQDPMHSDHPITDQGTGYAYSSSGTSSKLYSRIQNMRASVSYVTGTHNLKVGTDIRIGSARREIYTPGDATYRLNNGVPNQVTYSSGMRYTVGQIRPNAGFFAQDQWTLSKLTLSGGLRFDWNRTSYPDQHLPGVNDPSPQIFDGRPGATPTFRKQALDFKGASVLNWKDLDPRVSAAYDMFGNGKTALKFGIGRYVMYEPTGTTDTVNPVNSGFPNTVRTWTDANRDFIVQGDPFNPAANGELGRGSVQTFGSPTPILSTNVDPSLLTGWNVRRYNWEMSLGIQHEVLPSVAVSATWFRRWYGNFLVTDNLAFAPTDYSAYSVTVPVDPRLPGGGGQTITGLYDLNPDKVGLVNNVIRTSAFYGGGQIDHWSGVDVLVNARTGKGVLLQGGLSTGKSVTDNCKIVVQVDNPSLYGCHLETPFLPSVKFLGSWTGPKDVIVAATFQNNPPPGILATTTFSNASIVPSLGRNLSAGASANVSLNTVLPGVTYGERMSQLDLRLSKALAVGKGKLTGSLDIYNVLNGSNVLSQNNTYGTTGAVWLVPTSIVPARIFKLEARYTF